MTTELRDAIRLADARKKAAIGELPRLAPEDETRKVLVGLEIDHDDLLEKATMCADHFLAIQTGTDPAFALLILSNPERLAQALQVMKGAWIDGLLTGLMLAHVRGWNP